MQAQSFTINSSTQITAIVASGGATGNVQVVSSDGIAASSQVFTFTNNVTASSATLSFPPTRVNTAITLTVALRNNDNVGVQFTGTSISGTNASDFSVVGTSIITNASIGAGQMQVLTIRYRPGASTTRSAVLNVMYAGKPTVQVMLFGQVDVSPLLEVSASQITTPPTNLGEYSAPVRYDLRGEYLSSAVIAIATGDIQMARSSSATAAWASRLEIPNDSSVINVPIWVRCIARQDGVQSSSISHWAGASNVVVRVSSFTNISYISVPQTLDVGSFTVGQTVIASYNLQANNVMGNLTIQPASGIQLAFDDNGPWQTQMTLTPIDRTIATRIFVRTEASTHGTLSAAITHTIGARSAQVLVRGKVARAETTYQSTQIVRSVLTFGYVPVRQSSIATYWLSITNATTPITITAPNGFTLALQDDGSWTDTLTFTPRSPNMKQIVFVRFTPRWNGLFTEQLRHSFNGTTATLGLFASSKTPTLGIQSTVLDFGRTTTATTHSITRTYRIDADGVSNPIHITLPRGTEARLSEFGAWAQHFVITPREGQAAVQVTVRLTAETLAKMQTLRETIVNTGSENNMPLAAAVPVTANLPQANSSQVLGSMPANANDEQILSMLQTSSIDAPRSYPNPFADVVTLQWQQREHGRTQIMIHAANGALVRVLSASANIDNLNAIQWDGRNAEGVNVPNGAYFGQIVVNGVATGQVVGMMLAR